MTPSRLLFWSGVLRFSNGNLVPKATNALKLLTSLQVIISVAVATLAMLLLLLGF